MCGREIFIDTLGNNTTSDEVRKMLSYQTQQKSKITKVPKPEYILRALENFNKSLFKFKDNTEQYTPNYKKGGNVLFGVKSYFEYMYKKKFTILQGIAIKNESKHRTFRLAYDANINEWCSNPIKNTGGRAKKSNYFTKNIENDRPEIICVNITPSSHGRVFNDEMYIQNTVFDVRNKFCSIDGVTYVQDSIIISNHNKTMSNGHAIAGITCGNKRYVYNGWTAMSTDPAMQWERVHHTTPCDLFPMDWLEYQDDFCISRSQCDLPKVLDGKPLDLCFNSKKGFVFHLLYRKDIYDRAIAKLTVAQKQVENAGKIQKNTPCKQKQGRDSVTHYCKKVKDDVKTLDKKKNIVAPVNKGKYKPCKPHQFRDPITHRCKNIKKDLKPHTKDEKSKNEKKSAIAPSIESKFKPCKPHQRRDPQTNRCRNKTTK
jgi:hypothetical protein